LQYRGEIAPDEGEEIAVCHRGKSVVSAESSSFPPELTSARRAQVLVLLLFAFLPSGLASQSLRGSETSLERQNLAARQHDFSYLRSAAEVDRFVSLGLLVPVRPNRDFEFKEVSFPYARPELKLFIERLARQYRAACGEKLVVTSLTRPKSRQPRNASQESVHPTGMAADIRRSNDMGCRSWIEDVLLYLEENRILEATRERRPPHYHVAIFPKPYAEYVGAQGSDLTRVASGEGLRYRVRRGDSLWTIARKHGTTVETLKRENGLRSSRIYAGQLLTVPLSR
jgi:hypothetical protein